MDAHDQVLCVLCMILALCGVGWPNDLDSGTEKLSKWCSESVVCSLWHGSQSLCRQLRAGLDPNFLAKWHGSAFRCYLVNIVQS
jgi:hypothetical protein